MSNNDFTQIANFEEIIELAKQYINGDYELNFSLKVMFPIEMVRQKQLLDVVELAEDFQEVEKPERLYINHGSCIGEKGIAHIVNELTHKNNGNRALMSLISQRDIIDTGDKPIPSFMILQFSFEDGDLYVTTYFRALEVSKFLRINIEEIRMIIDEIAHNAKALTIKHVKLNLFAFRAYINENINTLIRPQIEMQDSASILYMMQAEPLSIIEMLKEKVSFSTVIENKSLEKIDRIVKDKKKNLTINDCFKTAFVIQLLQDSIESGRKLEQLRQKMSHNKELDDANEHCKETLEKLIEELENVYSGRT